MDRTRMSSPRYRRKCSRTPTPLSPTTRNASAQMGSWSPRSVSVPCKSVAASASYEAWRQFGRTGDSPWDTFTPASWVFYAIAFAWAIWMRRGSRLAWRVTFALCTAMIAGTAFFYLPQVFPARSA